MRNSHLLVSLIVIALACAQLSSAQSLTPKPLHTDSSLAALIAVRGQFTSLIVDEQRQLTMRVWAADFSPNEQVDFDQLLSQSFSELGLPEEPGWGLFAPSGNYLEIQVRVTDQQGRLGRVEFRNAETWQLVGSIWANSYRTEAAGVFSIPADLREMVAEVLNDTGRVLARIAVDVGKFDKVVATLVPGRFQPYRSKPVYCSHFSPHPSDVWGELGEPRSAPGAITSLSGLDASRTVAYVDFANDNVATCLVPPPEGVGVLKRKETIAYTVDWGKIKVGDPQSLAQLEQMVRTAAVEDLSPAVPSVEVPPYSEGCIRWRVTFTGRAYAVLAIPYERKKRQRTLEAFLNTIHTLLAPQRGFLSVLAANAANSWLQDLQNQQTSGLKPGEVVSWGDVYSVLTDEVKDMPRLQNLTQEWTVYVKVRYPNGSGGWTIQDAEGDVEALHDAPLTSPSPPAFPSPGTVHVGTGGATIHLGKGWRWKLRLTAPGGEEKLVEVPSQNTVVTLYITLQTPPGQPPGGS